MKITRHTYKMGNQKKNYLVIQDSDFRAEVYQDFSGEILFKKIKPVCVAAGYSEASGIFQDWAKNLKKDIKAQENNVVQMKKILKKLKNINPNRLLKLIKLMK